MVSSRNPSTPRLEPKAGRGEHGVLHIAIVEIEVGLLDEKNCGDSTWRRRASHCQAEPPKIDSQLLGGEPSPRESAQTYQSAFGLSRLRRLSLKPGMFRRKCAR